jgi:hypothetical protein
LNTSIIPSSFSPLPSPRPSSPYPLLPPPQEKGEAQRKSLNPALTTRALPSPIAMGEGSGVRAIPTPP